jgi:NAD(P)H-hydrate epimerase
MRFAIPCRTIFTMHVLTAAEMQACDRLTSERFGVPSIELMRTASTAVAGLARQLFPKVQRVTLLCGRGNNGGDGMMVARLLSACGVETTTILLGPPEDLQGDAALAWKELNTPHCGFVHVIREAADLADCGHALQTDLLVDAVVGTGFMPPLRGLALAALEWVRTGAAAVPVLAVDLPSGWGADETSATVAGPVFAADVVVTFTAPKPAHVFGHLTRRWDQPVVVAAIGSTQEAIEAGLDLNALRCCWAGSSMTRLQAPRAVAANKGNFGHVLVVGGTFGSAGGKAGAPSMAALAALRAGAGLVTAAVPSAAMAVVAAVAPELMIWPMATNPAGQISAENLEAEQLVALTAGKTILVVGPGMGQAEETVKFLDGLLCATRMPAVIDADALNILAAHPDLLAKHARRRALVLTPHPGEMARLAGITTAEVQANRLDVARQFAQRLRVTLVLKGARTLIAHPDGRVAVNTSGNPAMAKGGSGDLLAGLIAGLLAQYPQNPEQAVEGAVYLHGLAADFAVRRRDEHTLLATDTLAYLSDAFLSRSFRFESEGPNRYLWLQGFLTSESLEEGRS